MSCSLYIGFVLGCAVLMFIVVGIPVIVVDSVVKPQDPTYTLDYASISGFNLTSDSNSNHLTSFFNVVIRANNPNHKLKLKYRSIRIAIYKDNQKLAVDSFPGFTQRKRNVTMIRAEPVALNVGLKKGPGFDFGLESGMGYLDFDVFMTAQLNGQNLEVNCVHAVVNVTAPPIVVAADSPSSSDNGQNNFRSVGCSVYIYSDNDY